MDESILISVKRLLGIESSYSDFDFDIIMSINSAIHTLYQVGYEPAKNFIVDSIEQTWEELSPEGGGLLSLIKTYIYTKVRMLFDPPTSSFVLTSLENQSKELEWRIYAEMEGGFDDDESEDDKCECENCPGSEDDSGESEDDGDDEEEYDPWDGVPPNQDPDGLSSTLRRLRNEMGRP